jgi:hypothetical protein
MPPPSSARASAAVAYGAWADSAWQRWQTALAPMTERRYAILWHQFHGDSLDAGWSRLRLVGVRGPGGRRLAVFSAWLHDDLEDGTPNTAATWLVDGWGLVVGRATGHVDIYGTSDPDGDGIDDVITSRGVIHWDGTAWRFPAIYSEEPCLMHQVMAPPPGRNN